MVRLSFLFLEIKLVTLGQIWTDWGLVASDTPIWSSHCCQADVTAVAFICSNNYQSDDQQTVVQLHTMAYANIQYLTLIPCPELKWEKIKMKLKTIRFTLCEAKYAMINELVYHNKQTQKCSPSISSSSLLIACCAVATVLPSVGLPSHWLIELHLYQSATTASKWMHTYLITSTSPSPTLRLNGA